MGYRATLVSNRREENLLFAQLDGSSEIFMDVILTAIMDLEAEGKTIADIKYKGKGTRRWFQMIYPTILSPIFFGIIGEKNIMIGYLVAFRSVISQTRKGIGIALAESYRGYGIGSHAIKHVQENLDKIFQPTITELIFETTRNNVPMMAIGHKLGFKEDVLPDKKAWGDSASNWVHYLWTKT